MSDSARFLGSGRKEEEKKKKKRNQELRNGIFAYQPDLDGRGDDAGERAVPREGGRRWLLLFGVEVEEVEVEVEVKGVEGEEEKVQSSTPINFSSSSSELSFFLSLPPVLILNAPLFPCFRLRKQDYRRRTSLPSRGEGKKEAAAAAARGMRMRLCFASSSASRRLGPRNPPRARASGRALGASPRPGDRRGVPRVPASAGRWERARRSGIGVALFFSKEGELPRWLSCEEKGSIFDEFRQSFPRLHFLDRPLSPLFSSLILSLPFFFKRRIQICRLRSRLAA